jgi:hypothetical protein
MGLADVEESDAVPTDQDKESEELPPRQSLFRCTGLGKHRLSFLPGQAIQSRDLAPVRWLTSCLKVFLLQQRSFFAAPWGQAKCDRQTPSLFRIIRSALPLLGEKVERSPRRR